MEALAKLVGERLRAARRERGLSVGALAETAGIGKGSLSEVENGVRNPTLSTLYALAGALGLPLSSLLADRPGARVSSPGVEALLLDVRESGGATVEVYRLVLDAGGTPPVGAARAGSRRAPAAHPGSRPGRPGRRGGRDRGGGDRRVAERRRPRLRRSR